MTSYFVNQYFLLKVKKNLELLKLASGPFGCCFMQVSPFGSKSMVNRRDIILGCPSHEMMETLNKLSGDEAKKAREKLLDLDTRSIYVLVYSTDGQWDTFVIQKDCFSFPPLISLKVSGRC